MLSVVGEKVSVWSELLWECDATSVVAFDGLGEVRVVTPFVPSGNPDPHIVINCDQSVVECPVVQRRYQQAISGIHSVGPVMTP